MMMMMIIVAFFSFQILTFEVFGYLGAAGGEETPAVDDCEDGRGVSSTKGLKIMMMMIILLLLLLLTTMMMMMMMMMNARMAAGSALPSG